MFNFPSFRRRAGKKPGGCPDCGAEVSGDWEFCPKCGARLRAPIREAEAGIPSLFSGFDLFADIDKQLEEMDSAFFGGRKSVFEIPKTVTQSRLQRAPSRPGEGAQVRGGGISIAFSGGTGMPPSVTIHTSGDFKPLEPELRRKFGIQERRQMIEEEQQGEEPRQAPPEITEEPEAELVKGAGGKISVLKVKLPDVKSAKDIKISRLPNSIEIKAYVKNKAYFKLFQVPPTSRVVGTGFRNGILTINIE